MRHSKTLVFSGKSFAIFLVRSSTGAVSYCLYKSKRKSEFTSRNTKVARNVGDDNPSREASLTLILSVCVLYSWMKPGRRAVQLRSGHSLDQTGIDRVCSTLQD